MLLVLVVLGIFLFSVRTALIVAVTIPFALLFAFICLDWAHIPANLLSIGAIDFGMIVDGAVVMVENIFRELAERHGEQYDLHRGHPRRRARRRAADLLRGRRHHRGVPADLRADRPVGPAVPADGGHDVFALLGVAALHADAAAGAVRLSSCASTIKEPRDAALRADPRALRPRAACAASRHRGRDDGRLRSLSSRRRCCSCRSSAPSSCRTSTKARCGCARRCRTRSRSRSRRSSARRCATLLLRFPAGHDRGHRAGPARRRHRSDGFFNDEFFVGLKPYDDPAWSGAIRNKAELIDAIQQKLEAFPGHHLQLHAAGRGRRGRGGDRAQELAGGEDLRARPRRRSRPRPKPCSAMLSGVPGITGRHPGAGARAAEPHDRARPREDRALRAQRRRHQHADRDGGRRHARPRRWSRASARSISSSGCRSRSGENMDAIKNLLVATPDGQHLPLSQFADIKVEQRRVVHLPREQLALHRHAVQRRRARPGERGAGRAAAGGGGGAAADRLHLRLGRRVQGVPRRAVADARSSSR